MTTQIKKVAQVIEAEAGRDIIIVVDNKPVVVLRAERISQRRHYYGSGIDDSYDRYEYCGMGITVNESAYCDTEYVSGCATTLALDVQELTIDAVNNALAKRYGNN